MKENQNHSKLWEAINEIRGNDLAHIQSDISELKTNVSWLIDNHRAMRTTLYSILGGIIITIILVALKLQ